MKRLSTVIMIATFALTACDSESPSRGDTKGKTMTQSAVSVHHYQCESGNPLTVSYPTTDSATLDYLNTQYNMHIAMSGSGARYVVDNLEWWTKVSATGAKGTLFKHLEDGSTGNAIETCTAL